jgi:hypothetical protein
MNGESMDHKKKMAAALAAVTAYIKTEEEALCLQAAPPAATPPRSPTGPVAPANLWGISGRQALMQMGTMMQLKVFHRP